MTFWRGHIAYLLIIATLGLGAFEWLKAHDALLLAQQQAKESEAEIGSLRSQIAARDAVKDKAVQVIVKQQKAVETPQQAIQAMPDVSNLPVTLRPLPNSPDYVVPAADLVPLYNELAEGRKCSIELTACQKDMTDELQIQGQQAQEIKALQKATGHHGFFGKVLQAAEKVGLVTLGIAAGVALGKAGL